MTFLLWLCWGCPRRPPEPLEIPESEWVDAEEAPPETESWRVVNGPWRDLETGLALDVLEGWSGRPGPVDSPLRIRLEHASSGASLEIRGLPPSDLQPRVRAGCEWGYTEEGIYSRLRVTGEVRVATCLPEDPGAPRVLATLTHQVGFDWHLELLVPQGYLGPAKTAADELMSTIRFGG